MYPPGVVFGFLAFLDDALGCATFIQLGKMQDGPYGFQVEICEGFGITMSQLFAEDDVVELSPELREVFDCWVSLTPDQKKAALAMLKAMNHDSLE